MRMPPDADRKIKKQNARKRIAKNEKHHRGIRLYDKEK